MSDIGWIEIKIEYFKLRSYENSVILSISLNGSILPFKITAISISESLLLFPSTNEPNKYILELGNAVANILRGDIHDFLDSYYEDKLEGILGELYIQDAESGVDREIDYNSEDTIEKAQDIMDNLTNKTEILSEGDKSWVKKLE